MPNKQETQLVPLERPHDPLTMQDILMERINFEERRRYRSAPSPALPKLKDATERERRPWPRAVMYVFKRSISLATP